MAAPSEETALNNHENDGELVTEFPPPPFYYTQVASLKPPPIPYAAIQRASLKALEELKKKKEDAEKLRLASDIGGGSDDGVIGTDGVGNTEEFLGGGAPDFEKSGSVDDGEKDEEVVAVFGEFVEDPLLAPEDECDDPKLVRTEINRLNKEIIQGFVKLVRDLVNRPTENKKSRDELSHNIFLMLQECNKFREHQAREVLIETLEAQLRDRQKAVKVLQHEIEETDKALLQFESFNTEKQGQN